MCAGPFLVILQLRGFSRGYVLDFVSWGTLSVLATTLSAPGDSPGQALTCYQCSHHAAPLLRGSKASPAAYTGQGKG